ncbi:MAG: 30S ribosomal protein S15 [Planctomycetota bacterium]|nr:30S ribosomal protein S15 [Planctomycetota bacterium]MDA1166055.1 30S ribosomal protein S15 [Planctomycetota bacterium]
MSITAEKKLELIGEFKKSDADTGSPEIQVAVLTHRITNLTEHLRANKKDHACRRGLLTLVARRRSLLNYISKQNEDQYKSLIEQLGIRK